MAQKKNKVVHMHDGFVKADHIYKAQQAMVERGPSDMLNRIYELEPELISFLAAGAKDIAAHALMDSEMTRSAAKMLQERIAALALSVYGCYSLAMNEHFSEMFKRAPIAALDVPTGGESAPVPTPPSTPPSAEEGGACVA